jgi:hypothetical protein
MFANNGRYVIGSRLISSPRSKSAPSSERMPHPQEDWSHVLAANAQAQQGRRSAEACKAPRLGPYASSERRATRFRPRSQRYVIHELGRRGAGPSAGGTEESGKTKKRAAALRAQPRPTSGPPGPAGRHNLNPARTLVLLLHRSPASILFLACCTARSKSKLVFVAWSGKAHR